MYSDLAQEHIGNPRNAAPLASATHQGVAGVPGEGPFMILWLEIRDGIIRRTGFQTYGCVAAIATGSFTTTLITGRTVEQASRLTAHDLINALKLPEGKEECAHLAIQALNNASKEMNPSWLSPSL
jgi:nitrogen fixation NifU-like protein